MKGNGLTKFITKGFDVIEKHQKEILLGITLAGTVTTAVLSFKAGLKAEGIIAEHKENFEAIPEDDKEARKKEVVSAVKDIAPIVLPPIVSGVLTLGTAFGGYSVSSKEIAALSAAYTFSKDTFNEYKDKAAELLGDQKAEEIKDEVNAGKLKTNPPSKNEVIVTGRGKTLCYDDYSGRYFISDAETIKKAVNEINRRLMDEYYISLNEFYGEIGLKDIKLGEDLGFCVDDSFINMSFSATLTDDNEPCLVLNYDISPKYGYGDMSGRFGR